MKRLAFLAVVVLLVAPAAAQPQFPFFLIPQLVPASDELMPDAAKQENVLVFDLDCAQMGVPNEQATGTLLLSWSEKPGFIVTGSGDVSVSLPDCIQQTHATLEATLAVEATREADADVVHHIPIGAVVETDAALRGGSNEAVVQIPVQVAYVGQISVSVAQTMYESRGEPVEITAQVTNHGNGQTALRLQSDKVDVPTLDVTLERGETQVVTWEFTPPEGREHTIQFQITPYSTQSDDEGPAQSVNVLVRNRGVVPADAPAVPVGLVLVALALLVWRRR